MEFFHHEPPTMDQILVEANNFFFAVKKELSGDKILPIYYYLSINLIKETTDSLKEPNPLKAYLYLPISYLYSEMGLLLQNNETTHNALLNHIVMNEIKEVQHTPNTLEKIKDMHKERLNKIAGEVTHANLLELQGEVRKKEQTLDGWWGHAYIQEKEPHTLESIWDTKGKTKVQLSTNCAPISVEVLQVIKKVYNQQEYTIKQGSHAHQVKISNNDNNLNSLFARYYIADKFLDYAAFLFEDPFMVKNVLLKYSF